MLSALAQDPVEGGDAVCLRYEEVVLVPVRTGDALTAPIVTRSSVGGEDLHLAVDTAPLQRSLYERGSG